MKNNLYETFSDKWIRENGTIWIYSDSHFNDDEMKYLRKDYIGDKEQVKRINSKVGKNDTIIFLGDIGDLSFIKKVRGYKVLLMGNHEKGASNYIRIVKASEKKVQEIIGSNKLTKEQISFIRTYVCAGMALGIPGYTDDNRLFDEVYEGPLMVNDRLILSHEPIEGLPKYMFNIHGHDHSNWYKSDNSMNVCAEHIDYTPVNLLSLLKKGLLKNIDNIHRCCINKATKDKRKRELKNIDKKLKNLYNK